MKRNLLLLALAICSCILFAQRKQGVPSRPMQPSYGVKNATVIGTSKIRILYAFQPKDMRDMDTWIDCGQLLTDKGMTQYSSYFLSENDIALREWLKKNKNKPYYPNALKLRGYLKDYWSEYQYSQIYVRGKELSEWAVMPSAEFVQYRYKEPFPTMPWKFGGLPGLIMKIHDTKNLYTWEAVSVENGSFPIYQLEERFFKDTDRKKVWKAQREWNVKYNELSGRTTLDGRILTKRFPYEQLELE